jgi:hypothetical protein
MIKNRIFFLIFLYLIFAYSCKKTYGPKYTEIVINELMPYNKTTVTDNYGEFDDWIELYNLSSSKKDISGYFLSDSKSHNTKWQFPQGTSISGNDYLIIWADKDTMQLGLHANFKLSSSGEKVVFSNPDSIIVDDIEYSAQTQELSYSRVPNGTGAFIWKKPTYNKSNN